MSLYDTVLAVFISVSVSGPSHTIVRSNVQAVPLVTVSTKSDIEILNTQYEIENLINWVN